MSKDNIIPGTTLSESRMAKMLKLSASLAEGVDGTSPTPGQDEPVYVPPTTSNVTNPGTIGGEDPTEEPADGSDIPSGEEHPNESRIVSDAKNLFNEGDDEDDSEDSEDDDTDDEDSDEDGEDKDKKVEMNCKECGYAEEYSLNEEDLASNPPPMKDGEIDTTCPMCGADCDMSLMGATDQEAVTDPEPFTGLQGESHVPEAVLAFAGSYMQRVVEGESLNDLSREIIDTDFLSSIFTEGVGMDRGFDSVLDTTHKMLSHHSKYSATDAGHPFPGASFSHNGQQHAVRFNDKSKNPSWTHEVGDDEFHGKGLGALQKHLKQRGLAEAVWTAQQAHEYLTSNGFTHDSGHRSPFEKRYKHPSGHVVDVQVGGQSGTSQSYTHTSPDGKVKSGHLSQLPSKVRVSESRSVSETLSHYDSYHNKLYKWVKSKHIPDLKRGTFNHWVGAHMESGMPDPEGSPNPSHYHKLVGIWDKTYTDDAATDKMHKEAGITDKEYDATA